MTATAALEKGRRVIGEKWGSLTVLTERKEVGRSSGGKYYRYEVLVLCDCGVKKLVKYEDLRCGKLTGCGCKRGGIKSMGGLSRTKEYRAWKGMLERCYDPSYELYHRYGGRGIIVCERWKNSLPAFISDMGVCPPEFNSIDREDNDGIYELKNCRWANENIQANNRSTNLVFEINGEKKSLKQWAKIYEIKYQRLWARVRNGWDINKALKTTLIDSKFKSK